MTRRAYLAVFLLLFCASTAWPKWKEEEQKYLDDQFAALTQQVQALGAQVQTLNTQLNELRQNQAQLQAVIIRQQRSFQDVEQLVSSMRLSGEENFSGLKAAISQVRAEQQKAFTALTGQVAATAGPASEVGAATKPATSTPAAQGYVMDIKGNDVTVDLGTAQGIRSGSHLAVYKATDPNTRVGVLEVTQAEAANSRARVVTMNPGMKPEFSDIVRLE